MFERFTDRARQVVVLAQEESATLHHDYVGTEHLLLGILGTEGGAAADALGFLGVSLHDLRCNVIEIIGTGEAPGDRYRSFTSPAKKSLELALREALQFDHNYIGTEHILLGLIREGEGIAARVLVAAGVDLELARKTIRDLLSPQESAPQGDTPLIVRGPRDLIDNGITAMGAVEQLIAILNALQPNERRATIAYLRAWYSDPERGTRDA